jgi:hypothetical protein
MTPVNIFKMQATEHYSPVLLRSWADPRLAVNLSSGQPVLNFSAFSLGIYKQAPIYYVYMGTGQGPVRPRLSHIIVHDHTPFDLM